MVLAWIFMGLAILTGFGKFVNWNPLAPLDLVGASLFFGWLALTIVLLI